MGLLTIRLSPELWDAVFPCGRAVNCDAAEMAPRTVAPASGWDRGRASSQCRPRPALTSQKNWPWSPKVSLPAAGICRAVTGRCRQPTGMATDERRRFVLAACLRAVALGIAHTSDSGPGTETAFITVSQGLILATQSTVGLAEFLEAGRRPGRLVVARGR